jgi:hypothetical protein
LLSPFLSGVVTTDNLVRILLLMLFWRGYRY